MTELDVAVVGGGVAGATLAWRLADTPGVRVRVYTGGDRSHSDASSASGGLTRGFETDPRLCGDAASSLAELLDSPRLREWAGYREIGSVYLLRAAPDGLDDLAGLVHERLPGSLRVLDASEVQAASGLRLHEVAAGAVAIVETRAGYLSPAALRANALAAAADAGAAVVDEPVHAVDAVRGPTVQAAGRGAERFDAVVLAAGAWTPRLLAAAGLDAPAGELRTKHIQYSLVESPLAPPAFVDDTSDLYGRAAGEGRLLLGLPSERWDADPEAVVADADLAARVLRVAEQRLGLTVEAAAAMRATARVVAAVDCYHPEPGLRLRPVPGAAGMFTFTGGSGGAAKSVFATSRAGAAALLRHTPTTEEAAHAR